MDLPAGFHSVSIKDIARAAQVSHSTVSRALRNSPLVNAKTTERIQKIAAQRGYTVSAVARSLVTRRTQTIGVVVTTIADPFTGEVVEGIEEFALGCGYSVILATCHADPDRELRAVQSFHERRVDGILVMASMVGASYLSLLKEMKTPIVLVNSHHAADFVFSVRIDGDRGARTAVQHLLDLGHQRIAYIGDRMAQQSDTERFEGYRSTLKAAGIKYEKNLVEYGESGPIGGLNAAARLLSIPEPPTALFCYNDRTALGAMRAIREHGLRIPQDVSLVGFDDLFLSSYTDPPLTTFQQPKHEMGRQAAEILLELLKGRHPDSRVIQGSLIVRETTAPPRSE